MSNPQLPYALQDLEKADELSEGYAIALGLFAIARQLELLGMGDAMTGPVPIGAIEGLTMHLKEAFAPLERIADAMEENVGVAK